MVNEKISAIKNERERHFASVFFDHDEWEHHPRTIVFNGGRYTADFYDFRRKIYIEVVGTRQAFFVNRYKYMYLLQIRPDIKLEFRSHEGRLLDLYRFSLLPNSRGYPFRPSRDEKYLATGIMPEGYENVVDCICQMKEFAIAVNWKRGEIIQASGVSAGYISLLLNLHDRIHQSLLIKCKHAKKLRKFLHEWASHPERFPARRGFATQLTMTLLSQKFKMKEYYCPIHPTDTYFDDTPPKSKGGRRKKNFVYGNKHPPARG